MPQDLADRLHDFADGAVDRSVLPSTHDLWAGGRRLRRRRRAARVLTGAALVLLVVMVAQLVPGSALTPPQPATYDEAALAVPDHFWAPSPWAEGTGDSGPPGPLALVSTAKRGTWWLGTHESWYGVTAADQRYVWLDLPDQARDAGDIALSPDGRRVGYWLGGAPRSEDAQSRVVGFAVYDTVTGAVTRHPVATERGLMVQQLIWSADSARLVASFLQFQAMQGFGSGGAVLSWEPTANSTLRLRGLHGGDTLGTSRNGVVTWDDQRPGLVVTDSRTGASRRTPVDPRDPSRAGSLSPEGVIVNPAGTAYAMRGPLPLGQGSETTGLWVLDVHDQKLRNARLLGRTWQLNRVLGWLDDHRVLAEAHPQGGIGIRYVAYDIDTGAVTRVIRHTDPPERWLQASFATDLLQRPLVAGAAPAEVRSPAWLLVGSVSLLGAAAAVRLRRRVTA